MPLQTIANISSTVVTATTPAPDGSLTDQLTEFAEQNVSHALVIDQDDKPDVRFKRTTREYRNAVANLENAKQALSDEEKAFLSEIQQAAMDLEASLKPEQRQKFEALASEYEDITIPSFILVFVFFLLMAYGMGWMNREKPWRRVVVEGSAAGIVLSVGVCTTFICIAQSGPEEVRRFAQATEGKTHALKYIAQDPNFLNRFIAILDEED